MPRKVVAEFAHSFDRFKIDLARGPRSRTVGFDPLTAMDAGECLGKLAAVRVLDAHEENALLLAHVAQTSSDFLQQPSSRTARHVGKAKSAPAAGAKK